MLPSIDDSSPGTAAATVIREALDLLASVGISDICYQHSDSLEPNDLARCIAEDSEYGVPVDTSMMRRALWEEDAEDEGEESEHHSWEYYALNTICSFACVIMASFMAGLLMGIMSLDPVLLEVKARTAPTESEQRAARTLLPFVRKKNLMLVSILTVNCSANEALPLFLDRIMPAYVALLLSLTLVLFAGEILPSSYFTGRNQITMGAKLVPILRFVIIVTFPISYPMSKFLDKHVHGEDNGDSAFKRGEISALVRIQYEERMAWKRRQSQLDEEGYAAGKNHHRSGNSNGGSLMFPNKGNGHTLDQDYLCGAWESHMAECFAEAPCTPLECSESRTEVKSSDSIDDDDIDKIERALTFKGRRASEVYIPIHRVFAIASDRVLDEESSVLIFSKGYSRIPVYDRGSGPDGATGTGACVRRIRGILLTKQLIVLDKSDKRLVSTLPLYSPPCFPPSATMAEMMAVFQSGGRKFSHMALVCRNPDIAQDALANNEAVPDEASVLGIITFENVLEAIVGQIKDEKDRSEKAPMERARWAVAKWKAFVLKRRYERERQDSIRISGRDCSFDYRQFD